MPKVFTQNLSLLFVKIFIVSIFFTVICGDDKLRIFYFNRSRKNVRGLLKFPSGLLDDGRGTLLARSRRALQGALNEFIVGLLQHPDPTSNNGNSAT